MTEEEYKRLFEDVQKKERQGFGVSENNIPQQQQNPYQNLNEVNQQQQWQSLNETPDVSQFQIDENVNGGWGTNEFQVETRVNGVQQQPQNNNPFQHQQRRKPKGGQNLNGLDQFMDDDDDLNEVIKQPTIAQIVTEPTPNIEDVDVVSLEMFEKMNQQGLMSLHTDMFRS